VHVAVLSIHQEQLQDVGLHGVAGCIEKGVQEWRERVAFLEATPCDEVCEVNAHDFGMADGDVLVKIWQWGRVLSRLVHGGCHHGSYNLHEVVFIKWPGKICCNWGWGPWMGMLGAGWMSCGARLGCIWGAGRAGCCCCCWLMTFCGT